MSTIITTVKTDDSWLSFLTGLFVRAIDAEDPEDEMDRLAHNPAFLSAVSLYKKGKK